MRLALSAAVVGCALVSGCASPGPLPVPAADFAQMLEQRGLVLTPYEIAYDRAFERIDSAAYVTTYLVRGVEPPTRRRSAATVSVYLFETEGKARAGIGGLRHTEPGADVYADGALVAVVRGDTPGLALAMRRRFGPPVDA